MLEAPGLCSRKKREGNDAHCFLRVIRSVRMGHESCAENLQLPENRMHRARRETMEGHEKRKHHQSAEKKSGQRRRNHRDDYFGPESGLPFQDRPVSMRSRDRGAAQSTNEGMARARGQPDQPGGN